MSCFVERMKEFRADPSSPAKPVFTAVAPAVRADLNPCSLPSSEGVKYTAAMVR